MYCIINDGVIYHMSTVIAVCGVNFCAFISDSRKVLNSGNSWKVDSDSEQKIFRINKNLVFGATGLFAMSERILDPFNKFSDMEALMIDDAKDAVLEYIDQNKYTITGCQMRNYLLGGKNHNGQFCIYEIHYNPSMMDTDVVQRIPEFAGQYAVSLALPRKLCGKESEYMAKVSDVISSMKTSNELFVGITKIINGIAEVDETVGGDVNAVLIS